MWLQPSDQCDSDKQVILSNSFMQSKVCVCVLTVRNLVTVVCVFPDCPHGDAAASSQAYSSVQQDNVDMNTYCSAWAFYIAHNMSKPHLSYPKCS